MRRALCSSALLALVASTAASAPRSLRSTFAPNLGQARADCRFVSQRAGAAILLSPHAITLCRARGRPDDAIELQLANASSHVSLVGQCERAGRINYLRGSDSAQWLIGVPCYDEVHYTQVYPGIDLVVHAATDALEYDLIVAPGTSPDAIAIDCRGLRSLAIDDHGDLIMTTASGVLRQRRPLSYQIVRGERRVLPSRFRMLGAARFGFAVDGRDPGQLLIIDPLLEYSTFLGGSGEDRAGAVRVDAGGAAYVAGVTASLDFPFTGSAFPDPPGSGQDVFVVKLAPSGQDVVYATYFGGDDDDTGTDLAIDAAGNAVVVGTTRSADFPTTPGAYSRSHHGDGDVFACRLDATGVATYSTLLGGSGDDYALGVDLDPSGNAWLTGGVRSSDFPVTSNAFDKTRNGDYDVFVAELSATGQSLLYSTFVGGGSFDDGFDLAFHGSDQVYVTGRTRSSDFPTTSGAFDRSYSSSLDTFVFRLDVGDRNLVYSTFVSAPVRDEGHAIAVDGQGNAFVTGEARSEDFPVTDDAYDRSFNQGYDGFVFKLNPAGSALIYSTFIGGIINDVAWDLAIDDDGNAYVTGVTASANFPSTIGAYCTTFNGSSDAFVCKLDPTGSKLLYATFLGKSGLDEGVGIALDPQRIAYVTGSTYSKFFPTTPLAYDESWNGDYDAFVTKLELRSSCVATSTSYGAGWPGTSGIPALQCEVPVLCRTIDLTIGSSYGHATQAVLVAGLAQADIPTVFGGTLLLIPSLVLPLPLPGAGITLPVAVNCDPALCGLGVFMQVMELDPGASRGISFSTGLALLLGSE